MRDTLTFRLFVAATFLFPCAANAHPIVAGFERLYTNDKADQAAGGRVLLSELNCVSCHQPEGAAAHKQAPILDGVASRVRVSYLRKYVGDPQSVKPGSTMPNLFAGDADKDAKVDALVHFLGASGMLKHERADAKATTAGKDLYAKVGCIACHGPRDAAGLPVKNLPPYVVPLGDLKSKYSISSLTAFLDNPLKTRPSGRMPHLVSGKDARDLANYLLQGLKVNLPQGVGATNFAYYEGNWTKLPNFANAKPKATGVGTAFDLNAAKRAEHFGLVFDGFFKVEKDGQYKFHVTSDDGSKLLIDGKIVVNNDGTHPPQTVASGTYLAKGSHKVAVEFFNGSAGAELGVEIEGNGIVRQPLGAFVAPTEAALDTKQAPPKVNDEDLLELKPGLVEKGKALFASIGCANCHQLTAGQKPVASTLLAPALAILKPGGCLDGKPGKGLPDFGLSTAQIAALQAALKAPKAESQEPAAVIARTMTTLNCYACHARDKVGGPTEELNKFFLTVQPEMGDEGRVPPPLDGVGAKLNADYFKQILDKGTHDRPYMHTHMPGFGAANVGHLQPLFAGLDHVPAVAPVSFKDADAKVYSAARHMVGEQAFACIKCHTFNGVKAEGIQGIDMTLMPKRVTRDWFHFYLLDPQKVRPGTRMPSAFLNNMTPFANILDGTALTQIEAMWAYLKLGKGAVLPLGMGQKSIPLRPFQEAIIYRNFIQGAGARAIGVGYPEKMSLAFDANDMRLALIWQGAFIDAAKHWEGRGVGFEGPLGDNVLALPTGAPFAVLEKKDAAWPTGPSKEQGYKFIGYRLTPDERPTFDYSVNDVKIEDFPNPSTVGKDASLKRTLKLSAGSTVEGLVFRAAVGKKIEAAGDGWFKVDGWKMRIESAGKPLIRESGGKTELLVPVEFKDGKAQIVQELVW
jgi:mono/diheme cytochrome c family protein